MTRSQKLKKKAMLIKDLIFGLCMVGLLVYGACLFLFGDGEYDKLMGLMYVVWSNQFMILDYIKDIRKQTEK